MNDGSLRPPHSEPLTPPGCLRWVGVLVLIIVLVFIGRRLYLEFRVSGEEDRREELHSLHTEISQGWNYNVWRVTNLFEEVNETLNRPQEEFDEVTLSSIHEAVNESSSIAHSMLDHLEPLKSHPGTNSITARSYLESAISYWEAFKFYLEYISTNFENSPDTDGFPDIERERKELRANVIAAENRFRRAQCAFVRLVGYSNADQFCLP